MAGALPTTVTLTCSAFDPTGVVLKSITLVEEIDTPTRARVVMTLDTFLGIDDAVGKGAVLAFYGRKFSLIVTEVAQISMEAERATYVLTLEHAIVLLRYQRDHRVFLNKSAVDIVKAVFTPVTDLTATWNATTGTTVRQACLQVGETNYDFAMRLLADEGIFWFCPDSDSGPTMSMEDVQSAFTSCVTDPIPMTGRDLGEGIDDISVEDIVTSGAVSLCDYNYETPAVDLTSRTNVDASPAGEVFFYPGGYADQSTGGLLAKIRAEEIASTKTRVTGSSNVKALRVGGTFTVNAEDDVPFTICLRRVEHRLGEQDRLYGNSFVGHPSNLPYRPARNIAKPTVGTLSAKVTGAAGEEISVDKLGRFTSIYAFDRLGTADATSSHPIRLAQPVVGGSMMLARIGWELALRHLDGDPDRPVGTARMYDGVHPPPKKLPDNQTMTSFATLTSTADGTVNEITIDDKSGSMMFTVIASKDLDATVQHDETETIGANDTLTVGVDETILIGDKQVTEVDKDETITVNKDVGVEIAGDRTKSVTKDETTTITGGLSVRVDGDETESVGEDLSLSADSGFLETTKGKYDLTVDGAVTAKALTDFTIWVGGNSKETIGAGKTTTASDGALTESVKGDTKLTVGGGWTETVDGNRVSTSQGDMKRSVGAAGSLTAGGKIQFKGKTIKITVSAAATFIGGGGILVVSPASVSFVGLVTLKGSQGVEISGAPQIAT